MKSVLTQPKYNIILSEKHEIVLTIPITSILDIYYNHSITQLLNIRLPKTKYSETQL